MAKNLTKQGEFIPTVGDGEDLGVENMAGDITFPRLKIAQALTPEKPEGIKLGDFFNSITQEKFGNKIVIIPLFFWKTRSYLLKNKLVCISQDMKSPSQEFTPQAKSCNDCTLKDWNNDEPPKCNVNYNFAVITEIQLKRLMAGENEMPMILSGQKTATKNFKKIEQQILIRSTGKRPIPIFGHKIELETGIVKFEQGEAYLIDKINHLGYVSEPEFGATKEFYRLFKQTREMLMKQGYDDSNVEGEKPVTNQKI